MNIEVTKKYIDMDNNQIKVFILPEGINSKLLFRKNKIKAPKNVLNDFKGNFKQIIQFYNQEEIIILLGLGNKKEMDLDNLQHCIKHLGFLVSKMNKNKIVYYLYSSNIELVKSQMDYIIDIHLDRKQMVKKYLNFKKTKKNILNHDILGKDNSVKNNSLKNNSERNSNHYLKFRKILFVSNVSSKELNNFIKLLDYKNICKYMGDAPANIYTPPAMVGMCKILSKKLGINIEVFGDKKLKKLGMNTLLSVSEGSKFGGYMVKMEINKGKSKPIVLVGKGITFDSGGNSIKSSKGMVDMKNDMLGAATVLNTLCYLKSVKSKKHVIVLLCIAENMPGMYATKPGDVIKSHSGKSVEIIDTDAEGRLVMADGISYAHTLNPRMIIDVATLTGQQESFSGSFFAGLVGSNPKNNKQIVDLSNKIGERLVEYPLYPENVRQTRSDIANVKNYDYGSKNGTIYAAAFLSNFVKEGMDWMHIDIAGVDFKNNFSTGFGIRLLSDYIEKN